MLFNTFNLAKHWVSSDTVVTSQKIFMVVICIYLRRYTTCQILFEEQKKWFIIDVKVEFVKGNDIINIFRHPFI